MPANTLDSLLRHRDSIRRKLSRIGDLRPGSLFSRHRKCGKPNCRCARKGDPGHGPSWFLQRRVGKALRQRSIPLRALQNTRKQVAEHRRLQELTRELVDVNDRICHMRLRADRRTPAAGGPKKGASRRASPPRSPPKSSG